MDAFGLVGEDQVCLSSVMVLVYASLAGIDLLITIVAGIQVRFSNLTWFVWFAFCLCAFD